MRQHVHLAENLFDKRAIGRGMSEKRPVAAGNAALFEGLQPKRFHLGGVRGFRKTPDRRLMAVVQRLVQQLPDQIVFSRGANAGAVQRVIRRGSGVGIAELDKKLAQLGR